MTERDRNKLKELITIANYAETIHDENTKTISVDDIKYIVSNGIARHAFGKYGEYAIFHTDTKKLREASTIDGKFSIFNIHDNGMVKYAFISCTFSHHTIMLTVDGATPENEIILANPFTNKFYVFDKDHNLIEAYIEKPLAGLQPLSEQEVEELKTTVKYTDYIKES